MIPEDLLSAYPQTQFHILPGLLDSRAVLSNSYPNACVPMQRGSLFHFMMVFGMTQPGRVWEADTLTTKPTRHSSSIKEIYIIKVTRQDNNYTATCQD